VLLDALAPPAVADDPQPQPGEPVAQALGGVDGQLDPLVGDEPPEDDEAGVLGARLPRAPRQLGAVVDHRDVLGVDPELDELVTGATGDRDVLAAAVEPRRDAGLEEPAHGGDGAVEDDRPLLLVHVVDQHDHRGQGAEARAEGQAVLDVDDDVEVALGALELAQPPDGRGIDGGASPLTEDAVAVEVLLLGGVAVGGAQQGDVVAAGGEPAADGLGVALGPATLGVGEVAPAEEGDTHGCGRGRGRGAKGVDAVTGSRQPP